MLRVRDMRSALDFICRLEHQGLKAYFTIDAIGDRFYIENPNGVGHVLRREHLTILYEEKKLDWSGIVELAERIRSTASSNSLRKAS
jgi:hypothetical protein